MRGWWTSRDDSAFASPADSRPNESRSSSRTRAQSETVGVIMLVAAIVVLVGGFGVAYLGAIDGQGGERPYVDVRIDATADTVSITHHGGESVPHADLDVVVRRDAATERHELTDWTDSGDATFDPTDRVRGNHSMGSGQLTVLLVHTASNAVIAEDYLDASGDDDGDESESVTAAFTHSPKEPESGETVTFDASGSTGEGGISTYEWDWDGDGTADAVVDDPTVDHTFGDAGTNPVTLTVTDAEGNTDETTRSVVVGAVPPTIESTSLTDGDDDLVTSGDTVSVIATVEPGSSDVDSVIADASAFDAGDVALTDGNDDGTYDATAEVGESATDGEATVTIAVTDTAGNAVSAETGDGVTVDTTPPTVETFAVVDDSEFSSWFVYWEYVERFEVEWAVSDTNLADTTVTVERSGSVQETYSGSSGDEVYENTRPYAGSGREHTVTLVAVDAAGNRACRAVTDVADGTDPPESAVEAC